MRSAGGIEGVGGPGARGRAAPDGIDPQLLPQLACEFEIGGGKRLGGDGHFTPYHSRVARPATQLRGSPGVYSALSLSVCGNRVRKHPLGSRSRRNTSELKRSGDDSVCRSASPHAVLVVGSWRNVERGSCNQGRLQGQGGTEVVPSGWRRGSYLRHSQANRSVFVVPGTRGDSCRPGTRRLHPADSQESGSGAVDGSARAAPEYVAPVVSGAPPPAGAWLCCQEAVDLSAEPGASQSRANGAAAKASQTQDQEFASPTRSGQTHIEAESRANRRSTQARVPLATGDVGVARDHLPVDLRSRPRRPSSRARGLLAYWPGFASAPSQRQRASGTDPGHGQHQRAPS